VLVKVGRPIQGIHEEFLAQGADVVETDTFGANKLVFAEFDQELVGWTYEINKQAAEVARAACAKYTTSDKPRFVAGSMGPGTKLISLANDMKRCRQLRRAREIDRQRHRCVHHRNVPDLFR
jgi:5-methyltetrahydrofolate--homocysteine methyltransferase